MSRTGSHSRLILHGAIALLLCCLVFAFAQNTPAPASGGAPTILDRTEASQFLPATVFFRGQTATIQARNSAGLRLPAAPGSDTAGSDRLVLAAIVDTGGYASAIAQKYQAYLLTEVPLTLGDQRLAPGAYGFGFVENDRMVVMDIGAHDLFTTATLRNPALTRPTPLQILPDPDSPLRFRLYLGRSYVTLAPAKS